MNTPMVAVEQARPAGAGGTRRVRPFFMLTGIVMVVLAAIGFQEFYLHGREFGGTPISPPMFPWVIVHGFALTTWLLLFVAQATLIASRRRAVHMTLGWAGAALAALIVASGMLMVVRSVQASPLLMFMGMEYRQFLLVMFAEIGAFAAFVLAGLLLRKRPVRHRAMMLLATLSILAGATVRIPALFTVFGAVGWLGIFGPVLTLGVIILAARSAVQRTLDRWFAAGLAAMSLAYFAAVQVATTAWWHEVAHSAFGL